jgi:hypothetical protein
MSPAAIDRRLRTVAELWRFGLALGRARRIGPVAASAPTRAPEAEEPAR